MHYKSFDWNIFQSLSNNWRIFKLEDEHRLGLILPPTKNCWQWWKLKKRMKANGGKSPLWQRPFVEVDWWSRRMWRSIIPLSVHINSKKLHHILQDLARIRSTDAMTYSRLKCVPKLSQNHFKVVPKLRHFQSCPKLLSQSWRKVFPKLPKSCP